MSVKSSTVMLSVKSVRDIMEELIMDDSDSENSDLNLHLCVEHVRKLLEEQDVVIPTHCDQFIIRCIRVKNYNLDKATELVKNFGIMMRLNEMQDLFAKFKPSQLRGLYDSGAIVPLSRRDSLGRQVIIGHAGAWEPSQFDFDQAVAAFIVLFNYAIAVSEETQDSGVVFILNFNGWNLQHIRSVKIKRLNMMVKLVQSSSPGKVKGLHCINHPRIVTMLFMLVKPLLKAKLANRVFFHGDEKSLHKFVHPNILPENLGGTNADKAHVDRGLLNDLTQRDAYCQDMVKLGYPAY